MKASDIKDFVFNKSAVGGYKVSDVRGCLKEISEYVSTLEEENYNLDRENKSKEAELAKLKKTQEEIKEIVVSAHDYKNKLINEAKDKTEEMVLETKKLCEEMKRESEQDSIQKIENLKKEIEEKELQLDKLKQEVSAFRTKIFGIYKEHLDLVSKLPQVDEENSVINKNKKNKIIDEPLANDEKEESEVLEQLKPSQKTSSSEEIPDYVGFRKNLSENEHIFQKKINEDSDKDHLKIMKNADGYIKSRFDELK